MSCRLYLADGLRRQRCAVRRFKSTSRMDKLAVTFALGRGGVATNVAVRGLPLCKSPI